MALPALTQFATNPNVFINNGKAVTTSQATASYFHKLHKNVIQKIESLNCSPEFTRLNFQLSEYIDRTGRKLPMYEMTKDGFIFLVMGFTGKQAARLKEAYINAFNRMAEQIQQSTSKTYSPATHPVSTPYHNATNTFTLNFSSSEITQLNALFGNIEYLCADTWPKLFALFPNIDTHIRNAFTDSLMLTRLLKVQRADCYQKAKLVMGDRLP